MFIRLVALKQQNFWHDVPYCCKLASKKPLLKVLDALQGDTSIHHQKSTCLQIKYFLFIFKL